MKSEWLITNVRAVSSPAIVGERNLFVILDDFWPTQATFVAWEPILTWKSPFEPSSLSQDHLMNIEWLITDITAVGSPARADSEFVWAICGICWCNWAVVAVLATLSYHLAMSS